MIMFFAGIACGIVLTIVVTVLASVWWISRHPFDL